MITSGNADLLLKEMENNMTTKSKKQDVLDGDLSYKKLRIKYFKNIREFFKNIVGKQTMNNMQNTPPDKHKTIIISSKKGRINEKNN